MKGLRDPSAVHYALHRVPAFRGVAPEAFVARGLSSGLTNSSYRIDLNGETFLLRVPGERTSEFIDRAAEEHNARVAAEVGVNAEVLFFDPEGGTMLCRFIEGAGVDRRRFADDPTVLVRAALALRRVHRCGVPFVSRFDPFEKVDRYLDLLRASGGPFPEDLGEVLRRVRRLGRSLESARLVPCHNDPWPANFIDARSGMYLIDWEYSGMNDPLWDLADLSVEAGLDRDRELAMLGAYFGGKVPRREMRRLSLYKPVCDLLWSLWALVQHANGNPAEDFFVYALGRYERCKARFRGDRVYESGTRNSP